MSQLLNPTMLVLAREARGMSQSDLARATGVSQPLLSRIEAGIIQVTEETLVKLSEILDYPATFFTMQQPSHGHDTLAFHHRKKSSLAIKDLRRIHARLNILALRIQALSRSVRINWSGKLVSHNPEDYEGGPVEIARLIRQEWNLSSGPIANLCAAVEHHGVVVMKIPFGTDGLDGISRVAPGHLPLIVLNASMPADRMRWSLAHELGHVIMHNYRSDDVEHEANRFAAEFLMPEFDITDSFAMGTTLQAFFSLKPTWRVSISSLAMRAKDLRLISEREHRNIMIQMSKRGWRKNEPVPIPPEKPSLIHTMLEFHFKQLNFGTKELRTKLLATNDSDYQQEFESDSYTLRRVS